MEQKFIATNGIEVIYKRKANKYDFKHIIFVFSGFRPANSPYDFVSALNDCPAEIIWIKDSWENTETYYLCSNMDFAIYNAVEEFINLMIAEKEYSKQQITFTGYSKGGSAALYYGLKMNIDNIVVTVPQLHIGSYVHNHWQNVAQYMLGKDYNNAHISYVDRLLPQLLKQERYFERNIYLLTSEADEQYKTEITPYLEDFSRYSNFNLLKSYSVFVREHNQVTSHHTALLLSIYYALASEAIPRFNNGGVNFFGSQPKTAVTITEVKEFIADIQSLKIQSDTLFIDGVGIAKGYHTVDYADINYELVFKSENAEYIKKLAKANKPNLTREYFDGKELVIYDKANFTTYQYKGIQLDDIKKVRGRYQLLLKFIINGSEYMIPMKGKNNSTHKFGHYTYEVDNSGVYLKVSK